MRNILQVPVSDIVLDPRLQMRAEMNFNIIDEYTDAISDLPAGKVVMGEGGVMWLTDGWHTYHAHVKAKRDKMSCVLREGTFLDALAEAAGANHGHGIRRTAADKRRAISALLAEPSWRERSDRMIADACHVSNHLVGEVRKSYEPAESMNGKPESKTKEKDEKVATGNSPTEAKKYRGKDNKARTTEKKQAEKERDGPILCKHCEHRKSIGKPLIEGCEACAELRGEKKPEAEKKKPKQGKPLFDDRPVTDLIGKLARLFDARSKVYSKGPKHQACINALDKVLAAFHQWQVS